MCKIQKNSESIQLFSFPSSEEISIHEYDYNSGNPALYCSTYGKYNDGSLKGIWLDLTTFLDYDEFIDFCERFHGDEEDPELMFQDYMDFPYELYSEFIDEEDFDRIIEYSSIENHEALDAYLEIFNADEISKFEERYIGEYDSEEEFAEEYADECYGLSNSDSPLARYFDYEAFARDLFMDCYEFNNGYVFIRD